MLQKTVQSELTFGQVHMMLEQGEALAAQDSELQAATKEAAELNTHQQIATEAI